MVFNPGQLTRTIAIDVVTDLVDEVNETYVLNLLNANNATIGDTQGAGTIIDDDEPPTISIDDLAINETNAQHSVNFVVRLSSPSGQQVSVGFQTNDGSAVAPDDYLTAGGNVTFNPGQTSRNVNVQVKGDTLDEIDETFTVTLANPVNASIADDLAIGTILDNDPLPGLSVANPLAVSEGDAGTLDVTFTVTLTPVSGRAVSVDWATADDTAGAADYEAAGGTLDFPAGTTSRTVTVRVKGDLLDEVNETFFVNLTNPTNATLADGQAQGTIDTTTTSRRSRRSPTRRCPRATQARSRPR